MEYFVRADAPGMGLDNIHVMELTSWTFTQGCLCGCMHLEADRVELCVFVVAKDYVHFLMPGKNNEEYCPAPKHSV
jgi:hypothetical protein